MSSTDAFERSCRDTARQLRRMPADVRREISTRATELVAAPIARRIQAAYTGPWARALAAGTKARKAADPTIVVGGARRVVSGGASVRQLVYGDQFGGSRRVTPTTRRTRDGGRTTSYRLRSTRQFGQPRPAIIPTLRKSTAQMLEAFADLVLDVFDKGAGRG